MDFLEQKNQIIAQLKRDDRKEIAKRAGVTAVTVWKAFKKQSIGKMTPSEKIAWVTTIVYVNEKQNNSEGIEGLTSKLAGRL
jgi:hypothetical protein